MKIIKDFFLYMDTCFPKGIDKEKYLDLKYSVNQSIDELLERNPIIDKQLLFKLALKDYLYKSDQEILKDMGEYYGQSGRDE